MLSHELRNPPAAIRSADGSLESINCSDPLMTRVENVLARQSKRMAHLLDDLRDLARVTSGKLSIVRSRVDLGGLIRDVVADLDDARNQPNLVTELSEQTIWIDGDTVRIAQVVHNLLSNAIKYTPSDGRILVELGARDGLAILTVTDSGVGFDHEFACRLFEPFQQAPQDIARSAGGLGIGLALSKSIVDLHGGSISARSKGRGTGSTFEVRLPLTLDGTVEKSASAWAGAGATEQARNARVVIVEDNEDAAELLAALLRARRFDVELASRGEQALALIQAWRPDAVICDIGLPDIDGYTIARMLRADPSHAHVRLVALSGYGQAKDRMRAVEAGFDHHLTKPAPIDVVVRAIATSQGPRRTRTNY